MSELNCFDQAREYLRKVYVGYKNNDIDLPLLLWISGGTRLLAYNKNKGEVLAHVWLEGPSTIGKITLSIAPRI